MSGFPPPLFLTCTTRPSRALCSTLPTNFPCLVLIGSPILLPLVLLFPPRRVDLFVPPTDRKEGQIRFVSFRIVIISGCSWPSQHFCFFRKVHPLLVIVNPRPRSRHVVRPSVVMILVSSTRSSHTCDESWILMKPPAGICRSRNPLVKVLDKLFDDPHYAHCLHLARRVGFCHHSAFSNSGSCCPLHQEPGKSRTGLCLSNLSASCQSERPARLGVCWPFWSLHTRLPEP